MVGNEILNGTTLDTNSWWLSNQLNYAGLKVEIKLTVRDELETISATFRECISREPDWIFSIGGLGPTFDDLTAKALARALHKKWKLNNEAVKMLQEGYARRARKFSLPPRRLTRTRLKMATLPAGSTPLSNPVGSAPGILVITGKSRIVALPGVPKEMKAMFSKEVLPGLQEHSDFFISEEWIKIVGVSESLLAPLLRRIFRKYDKSLYIKSHPHGYHKGKPVIKVQIILNALKDEKDSGLEILTRASRLIELAAGKVGAESTRLKSVRRFRTGS